MTKNLKIRWKIIIPIALVAIIGAAGSYFLTQKMYKESEIQSYLNKAKALTSAAEGTRDFTAMQGELGLFKDSIEKVDDLLKTVPIIAAMEMAKSKAEELNFKLKVPSEQFRNPDNAPDSYEKNMLSRLRKQLEVNNGNDIWEIHTNEDGVEELRYFRAIKLTEDCMKCHGDPALSQKYWGNSKGLDPTGTKMENMKVGYMKGAFEVTMDMRPVNARVQKASGKLLGIFLLIGLLILIIALLVSRTITRPINKLQLAASDITSGNLNNQISFDRGDEIGELGDAFENVRTKINGMIQDSKELSKKLISGNVDQTIDTSNERGAYKELFSSFNDVVGSSNQILSKTSNVMIGNKEGIITYVNQNLRDLFNENIEKMREVIPDFDVDKLIGTNIDKFHYDPSHNRSVLDKLTDTHQALIDIGSLAFRLNITPIFKNGEKTSYVVVWENYTEDKNFQKNLNDIITKVSSGNLETRVDVDALGKEFKKTGESINEMLEAITEPFELASDYLDQISSGNLPDEIDKDFEGEYDLIKNNLNDLILTLKLFTNEMKNMSDKHDEGFISVLMNADKFQGVYKDMATGVNEMVNQHINTKKMAINVVKEFGKGNFDADIEKLPNEKAFINEAIDSVRANLNNFKSEVSLLIDSAQAGKLETRGQAGKFEGEWSSFVDGLNKILEAIVEPIEESGIVLSKMSDGDFTTRMRGEYQGAFNSLKNNINLLSESLSSLLFQLQESINTTAATAAELSSTSESLASASAEQSAQADEVASAVEEMSGTIAENARSSIRTSEVATKNGDSARKGGEIVKETIKKMKDIASVVSNSASTVDELGTSSKEIGEIVSVIDEIAEQTNMLALNAAIEAARAGDQGRGFAVVADEVRKLAERTSEATKKISTMISGIQTKTGLAVNAMNEGNKEVNLGIDLADKAGESLNDILSNAKEVLDMINQIAAASEEQSATSEEISKNVTSISQVTQDSSRQVQDVSYSAEDLSRLTNELEKIVAKFKFEQRSESKQLENSEDNVSKRLLN